MDKQRLETFGDAIIAIVLTILVLKLAQPNSLTIDGFWQIKEGFIAYFISFLIIFNVWYNNHNFFHVLDEVDDLTVWMQGFTLFMMSLLPYFTSLVSKNIWSLPAETMYALTLIGIHIFYVLTVKSGINHNRDNKQLIEGDYLNKHVNTPMIIILIGFIIGYLIYPPAIIISCLVTVVFWIITFRHFKDVII
ncbi:TMEM175 family protein [Methanobrevibacter sp.]|uniref:TMEM175 family protein n=1 Tax=Methanobrevibacter sp. TaxID=66852 RepID=UPI00388EEDCE